MVGDGGASDPSAKRELRAGQSIAKRMAAVADANTLAARRVLKVAPITALPMVAVGAAAT